MRIAIFSDIHDHVWNLAIALDSISGCDALICCGDLCSPFVIGQIARGFAGPVRIVFGNNDADLFRMTARLPRYPHVHLKGEFFEEEFAGRRVAVNHFPEIALAIARSDGYDAVFYGHNHVFSIATPGARTLAVNPGSIMGAQFDKDGNRTDVAATFAVYDTTNNTAEDCQLAGGAASNSAVP
jgi:hypothetical protein